MIKDTKTNILKRLEDKLDTFSCSSNPQLVQKHTEILASIPAMAENIGRILDNQEEQFKRLNKVEKEILVLDTQRKTERAVVLFICGVVGTIAGWFGKNL